MCSCRAMRCVRLLERRARDPISGTQPLVACHRPIMGFQFSKRKKLGKTTALNLSKSGASVSKKAGRVTVNSRGRGSVRLAKGLSFRFKLK